MQDARDHCREEQAPLDLFLVPIETRSFIFPGIDIRIESHLESYFSNACSPYATIPEYDAYERRRIGRGERPGNWMLTLVLDVP